MTNRAGKINKTTIKNRIAQTTGRAADAVTDRDRTTIH
jgi:hypothetical protein